MSAKVIMIQGTASSAGKSTIAAGLCRIFRQDGWSVAPFKAQNMALNSFVTREGLEMGRAQVVQAEAAGIEPVCDMNPVLLKPMGHRTSQVIVQGEVWRDMDAREYYGYKKTFQPKIIESFERLAARHDIIVIEGAGSPAEINLRENDVVNMAMAKAASAPVLLAGDIDRGGVFAALAGTLLLLTNDERRFVKGLLINKFRGDKSLLESGLVQIEGITGRPVLGVLPWLDIDLDDEDSLSERLTDRSGGREPAAAVVRFPHIANFTDFNALSRAVPVRYASTASGLSGARLIILPGTKNTAGDLAWLFETGLAAEIQRLAREGTPVFGICGGFQMLGGTIADPAGVESSAGSVTGGLGLLPIDTVFCENKTRTRVSGRIAPLCGPLAALSGLPIEGYELHMGVSAPAGGGGKPFAELADTVHGAAKADGCFQDNVYGSYVHGILDSAAVVAALAQVCGRTADGADGYKAYKEAQYEKLAAHLRANIDMEAVYRIIEDGV
jgi:adenosylcobyric acid synthase